MYILGLAGGLDPAYGSLDPSTDVRFHFHKNELHDSSAVLLKHGRVVAAIEEERVARIKHTNTRAVNAIRTCLHAAGIGLADVAFIAYPCTEAAINRALWRHNLQHPEATAFWSIRTFLGHVLEREFGSAVPAERFRFVEHHAAHALSAYCVSGFRDSLVVTLDGQGEGLSGTVFDARGGNLRRLRDLPSRDSLGLMYEAVIGFLGYLEHDEYKVMGLAPYGDPARFRHLMRRLYQLKPDGSFTIQMNELAGLSEVGMPRRKGEPFAQRHKDLAASLQEGLEEIVLHHLANYKTVTGQRNLCLAGGVAHNCSMNGRIRASGLFENVFVQPAAHDAGLALGAAFAVHREETPSQPIETMTHVYWGTDVPAGAALERELQLWDGLISLERLDDAPREAARMLAEGKVIGWVQGRSEFGPRALGNRSILADPRPAENKTRINAMVKKREAYRPFAPSVLEEYVQDYFAVPEGSRFPYMIMTADVRPDQRDVLRAVTHVNGSARLHTVSRAVNRPYWELIDQFRTLTGVPVVLNTSFNNNAEPIVDSVEDALVTFLTTGLDAVVIGSYRVTRRPDARERVLDLQPTIPDHLQLLEANVHAPGQGRRVRYLLRRANTIETDVEISAAAYRFLSQAGRESAGPDRAALADELWSLWERRQLRLVPAARPMPRVPSAEPATVVTL